MKRRFIPIFSMILAAPALAAWMQSASPDIAVTGVTVIDVVAGRGIPDQTVVVRGDRMGGQARSRV